MEEISVFILDGKEKEKPQKREYSIFRCHSCVGSRTRQPNIQVKYSLVKSRIMECDTEWRETTDNGCGWEKEEDGNPATLEE